MRIAPAGLLNVSPLGIDPEHPATLTKTKTSSDFGTSLASVVANDDVNILNGRTAQFTDVDGDLVTIRVSKGKLATTNFTLSPEGEGHRLALIDFHGDAAFNGANLSITAKRQSGGDGFVNVGHLDATGVDLGLVGIRGDLAEIDAGNALTKTPGIAALAAVSFGRATAADPFPDGLPQSDIVGSLGRLTLYQGMFTASLSVSGETDGRIGSLAILGRMDNASIVASGSIGACGIVGDLSLSRIQAGGSIAGIYVKGSVDNGYIASGEVIGSIRISGDMSGDIGTNVFAVGRSGAHSLKQALAIGSISVGGSISSSSIMAGYDVDGFGVNGSAGIGAVTVGFNWIGSKLVAGADFGDDQQLGTLDDKLLPTSSAFHGRIASIVIKGSSIGAGGSGSGFVAGEIGLLKIGASTLPLKPGRGNDLTPLIAGLSADVHVREVIPAPGV